MFHLIKKPKLYRSSAILTTIFLLFGITAVAMIGIEIIMNGLNARRVQGASIKAFYAAESGAERALSLLRVNAPGFLNDCRSNANYYINFSANPSLCQATRNNEYLDSINTVPTKPQYWVRQSVSGQNISLKANGAFDIRGAFERVSRQLNISFCLPDCSAGPGSDGCGGTCDSSSGGGGGSGATGLGGACTADSDCNDCLKCDIGGTDECVYQDSTQDIGDNCPALGCFTGTCNGSGSCGIYADGLQGNCLSGQVCQSGVCQATGCTNDSQCGFCQKCQTGSCVNQTTSEDTKNECSTVDCDTGFCSGLGSCDAYNDNLQHNCSAGYVCQSGVCQAVGCTNDSQCGFCQKCQTGSCVNQTTSEDTKNECSTANCDTGFCSGLGSCDAYNDNLQHNCSAGLVCQSGVCACVDSRSDAVFCSDAGKSCGSYTANDSCGNSRTANCGSCGTGLTCESNSCVADCSVTFYSIANMSRPCPSVPSLGCQCNGGTIICNSTTAVCGGVNLVVSPPLTSTCGPQTDPP